MTWHDSLFWPYTNKKQWGNFSTCIQNKKIQRGSGAKSYMKKGPLFFEEKREYLVFYEEAFTHVWLGTHLLLNFLFSFRLTVQYLCMVNTSWDGPIAIFPAIEPLVVRLSKRIHHFITSNSKHKERKYGFDFRSVCVCPFFHTVSLPLWLELCRVNPCLPFQFACHFASLPFQFACHFASLPFQFAWHFASLPLNFLSIPHEALIEVIIQPYKCLI